MGWCDGSDGHGRTGRSPSPTHRPTSDGVPRSSRSWPTTGGGSNGLPVGPDVEPGWLRSRLPASAPTSAGGLRACPGRRRRADRPRAHALAVAELLRLLPGQHVLAVGPRRPGVLGDLGERDVVGDVARRPPSSRPTCSTGWSISAVYPARFRSDGPGGGVIQDTASSATTVLADGRSGARRGQPPTVRPDRVHVRARPLVDREGCAPGRVLARAPPARADRRRVRARSGGTRCSPRRRHRGRPHTGLRRGDHRHDLVDGGRPAPRHRRDDSSHRCVAPCRRRHGGVGGPLRGAPRAVRRGSITPTRTRSTRTSGWVSAWTAASCTSPTGRRSSMPCRSHRPTCVRRTTTPARSSTTATGRCSSAGGFGRSRSGSSFASPGPRRSGR